MENRHKSLLLSTVLGFLGCIIFILIIHVRYRQDMYILKNEFSKSASNSQDYTLELIIWNNQAATFEQDYYMPSIKGASQLINKKTSQDDDMQGSYGYQFKNQI